MNDKQIIVGLDVGTTKVCTIVGLRKSSQKSEIEIIGIGNHPSHGLKKGSVVNIDKTIKSIQCSLDEARLMSGVNITKATIGIAGNHIYSFNSTGVVPIKDTEITAEDVETVIEAAKAVVIPSDREILHVIAQEYRVDNTGGIKDPIGMCGVRLEAKVHIVTGTVSLIQNLVKCVEQAGIITEQIMLQPIASSESVITDEEKEMGVVLVDIGGGTTDLAVWKDGSLIHSQIIPVGGNHFTNDLAVGLKVPHAEAERIKINHGSVISTKSSENSHITIQGMQGTKEREVSSKLISDILAARADELFDLIKEALNDKELSETITAGVILTGGGALICGMPELAEYNFERTVRIGYPIPFGGMTNVMKNPKYSTVLGLLKESAVGESREEDSEDEKESIDIIQKLSNSIRTVFKEIF